MTNPMTREELEALLSESARKSGSLVARLVETALAAMKERDESRVQWVKAMQYLTAQTKRAEAAEARLAEVREALNGVPEKLRLLADWFDMQDDKAREALGRMFSDDVQRDLRAWSDVIAAIAPEAQERAS